MAPGEAVINAFIEGKSEQIRNDRTDGYCLYLHGNPIAWKIGDGYRLTLAGHNTRLTRGRLNILLAKLRTHYRISQYKKKPYIFGRDESAPLDPSDEIQIDRGLRPAIKGKHRGIWQSVEKPSSRE